MKIVLAIFLCATCVLCHPLDDVGIPKKDVVDDKVLKADPSDNDIPSNGAVIETVTEEAVSKPSTIDIETSTMKPLINDLEKKGEKLFGDILQKIANEMGVKMNVNDTDSKTKIIKEKPEGGSFSATAEVGDLELDPNSKFTEYVPTEGAELVTPAVDDADASELPTFEYVPKLPVTDTFENPEDSVFGIVPIDMDQTETTFTKPKLDRNVNQLENENQQSKPDVQEETGNNPKLVEIPLDVQKPNQEDSFLPDVDIKDTIFNNSPFNNPILSPQDTLPLNISPLDPVENPDEVKDESVLPFALPEINDNIPLESNDENYNFIKSNDENYTPNDYDEAPFTPQDQDYNEYTNKPMNDHFDYDYDYPEKRFPVPIHSHRNMMNSHFRNNRPFERPNGMGNNYRPLAMMPNPMREYKTTVYNNEPFNGYQTETILPVRGPIKPENPKISNKEISQLIEQIFPGMFQNGSPFTSEKEITIFIEGNPEILTKSLKPLYQEKNPPFNKQNDEFIIEIGNMKPNNFPNKQNSRFNPFQVDTPISYNSPFNMMRQQPLMMQNPFNDLNIEQFAIKPVKETYNDKQVDKEPSNTDDKIEAIDQPNEMDQEMNDYEYDYKSYAPMFQHALFMHPEEYRVRYPNRQYMSRPYFAEFPAPTHYSNAGQRYNFPNRNWMPIPEPVMGSPMNFNNHQNVPEPIRGPPMNFNNPQNVPEPIRGPTMNFNNPQNVYNPRNGMRNNYNRFPTPDYYNMNNNNYNRFNSPNGYEPFPNY